MAGQNPNKEQQDDASKNGTDPDTQNQDEVVNEEYDLLDSKLDDLNTALDYIEQKNDDIHEKLKELLQSNIDIRQELQNEKNVENMKNTNINE